MGGLGIIIFFFLKINKYNNPPIIPSKNIDIIIKTIQNFFVNLNLGEFFILLLFVILVVYKTSLVISTLLLPVSSIIIWKFIFLIGFSVSVIITLSPVLSSDW